MGCQLVERDKSIESLDGEFKQSKKEEKRRGRKRERIHLLYLGRQYCPFDFLDKYTILIPKCSK